MPRPTRDPQTLPMEFPNQAVQFDPDGFDNFIKNNGLRMVHWRSMRCPVGLIDVNDVRRPHEHHQDCSNGFLYTRAGAITVSFLGNTGESRFLDPGRIDGSTVHASIPRFYDDPAGEPADFAQFDRLYLDDVEQGRKPLTVTNWHLFTSSVTGQDRLQFPVVHVQDLVDANGKRYSEGDDFDCVKGVLVWHPGVEPGIDPKSNKGLVCSIRYSYRPFWYVKNLINETRWALTADEGGDTSVTRMPQQVVLQRERVFENEERDPDAPNASGRQEQAPTTTPLVGRFGNH